MKAKRIIRCCVFFLLVCILLTVLCDLFEQDGTANMSKRFVTYRKLEENTIDAVYIGTSGVDRYWIPSKAYDNYGMTVYPLAIDSMPTWLFEDITKEIYTYQNPELIIVDIRCLTQTNESADVMDVRARRLLDSMPMFSVNRIRTAFNTMRTIHSAYENEPAFDISYLFSFVKYHPMWSDDDYSVKAHLSHKGHSYLGFFMRKGESECVVPQTPVVYDSHITSELDPITEEYFYKFLEYTRENNIELLFVDSPQYRTEETSARANTAYKLLEQEDLNYLHFFIDNSSEFTIPLDPETDFYNEGHVNFYGAQKYTDALAKYLSENYTLPDHRNDANVKKDWDGIYDKTVNTINTYAAEQE